MNIKKSSTVITIILFIVLSIAAISWIVNLINNQPNKGSKSEIPFMAPNNNNSNTEQILGWVLDKDIKNLKKSIKKGNQQSPELTRKIKKFIKEYESNSTQEETTQGLDGIETNSIDEQSNESKFSQLVHRIEEKTEERTSDADLFNSKVISFKINQNNIYYKGEIVDGKANGVGKGVFDNGKVYEGEWVNNTMNGKGKEKLLDGSYYEGEFLNNSRHGEGIYYFKNKEKFVGKWENNMRQGQGILYDKKGKEKYKGEWKNDIFIY